MGHDISAYKGRGGEGEAIAELSRGAFNPLAREIYKALDATGFDAGCSGDGGDAYFSLDRIIYAVNRLPHNDDVQPERDFLADCLKAGTCGVTISFC